MFSRLFNQKSNVDQGKNLTSHLLTKLDLPTLRNVVQTCKFFQSEAEVYLFKDIQYCEQRIKIALSEAEKLAKEIQQRTPFLCDLTISSFNALNIDTTQQKILQNQNKIKELFQKRDTAYRFILSIPISMIGSYISYSLGISIIKNLLLTYQSIAIMWLSTNHDSSQIKVSVIDFMFSSKLDQLYEKNSQLLSHCEAWQKATRLQIEEVKKDEDELENLLKQTP